MDDQETASGTDVFIVDNSDNDWQTLGYLREWAWFSRAVDITHGFGSYQISNYRVLAKWSEDRSSKGGERSRILSPDDVLHCRQVVRAISKTIELQAEIDRVIAAAGGFLRHLLPPHADRLL